MPDIDEIIDNFTVLDDWDDRYRYLIELGRELPPLAEAAHNDANKVQGCASQVWLDTRVRRDDADEAVLSFAGAVTPISCAGSLRSCSRSFPAGAPRTFLPPTR